jgi:hypothetical protein
VLTDVAADQFLTVVEPSSGAEEWARTASCRASTTVIHGALFLPQTFLPAHAALIDMAGRKATDLHMGMNDVSGLGSGVYFVRSTAGVHRIVLAR